MHLWNTELSTLENKSYCVTCDKCHNSSANFIIKKKKIFYRLPLFCYFKIIEQFKNGKILELHLSKICIKYLVVSITKHRKKKMYQVPIVFYTFMIKDPSFQVYEYMLAHKIVFTLLFFCVSYIFWRFF